MKLKKSAVATAIRPATRTRPTASPLKAERVSCSRDDIGGAWIDVFANGAQSGKLIGEAVVDALGEWSVDQPGSSIQPLDSTRASITSPRGGSLTSNIPFKR